MPESQQDRQEEETEHSNQTEGATGLRHRQREPMAQQLSLRGGEASSSTPPSSPSRRGADKNAKQEGIFRILQKLLRTVFPIYGKEEWTKFLLVGAIKFFVIMALTLTRDFKDTLVVTQCGAEAIAFLKIYAVLPAVTAFFPLYWKMASIMSKKALFYSTCIPFFAFFILYDVFIFPNAHLVQPSLATIQNVLGIAGREGGGGGLAIVASIAANWTSALYYVMAEMYSTVGVGILFWQFANDVVSVKQAKRFYPLFSQMSGIAPIFAGQYMVHYSSKAPDFRSSLRRLTRAITFAGINICLFYHWSTSFVESLQKKKKGEDTSSSMAAKKGPKKKKPSLWESAKFLASSEYLRLVATLVIGYGLSINFTEIMWKSLVKERYPDGLDYQRFMGNFSSAVGLATCIVIFLGVHVIRVLGWRAGALATPSVMAVMALPFFASILSGVDASPSRLRMAVIIGTVQTLLSKCIKYALFDPTTQMSYIPLDEESKVKGKAAIDVLGSRIGKSGGSLIQQALVFGFGNIINAAPALAVLFYTVSFVWISGANRLSKLFEAFQEGTGDATTTTTAAGATTTKPNSSSNSRQQEATEDEGRKEKPSDDKQQ